MRVEEEVLEIAMQESTYVELQNKAKNVRKIAGEWATQS